MELFVIWCVLSDKEDLLDDLGVDDFVVDNRDVVVVAYGCVSFSEDTTVALNVVTLFVAVFSDVRFVAEVTLFEIVRSGDCFDVLDDADDVFDVD
jgi:hypothetical protein